MARFGGDGGAIVTVTAALSLVAVLGWASPARAQPELISCLTVKGPCQFPDSRAVLPATASLEPGLVANFGLILPGPPGAGWQFVCEEASGGPGAVLARRNQAGRTFVGGDNGVFASDDGCGWTAATGLADAQPLIDLAIDPAPGGSVWVLGASLPRLVFLSTDGARSFILAKTFAREFRPIQLAVAPSDVRTIYAAGYTLNADLALAWSLDGGQTWSDPLEVPTLSHRGEQVTVRAVAPDAPDTLFVSMSNGVSDELWRLEDRGRRQTRLLTLRGSELVAGVTFGATGQDVYVAGTEILVLPGQPPAHLYRSRTGGGSWEDPVPSGPGGPRYRCLEHRAGKLLACGADRIDGDAFLLGESADEGRTWQPVLRLQDVTGPRACAAAACLTTSIWLCESYGVCAPGLPRPNRPDSGTAVVPDAARPGGRVAGAGGCGCALGGRRDGSSGRPSPWPALVVAVLVSIAIIRRRTGAPPG